MSAESNRSVTEVEDRRGEPAEGLRVTFLGTGTSVGIPVITCDCPVCGSDDPRNRRLRASLLLEWVDGDDERGAVLVDTATDLRQQALEARIERIDAVLYTHKHADHLLGLDELRIYNFVHRMVIPLYGDAQTLEAIRRMFPYAFDEEARGVPRLRLVEVDGPFELLGRRFVPVPVEHGEMTILAYRTGGFAYVTDCSGIPEPSIELLRELDVLVVDALRTEPHPSHFNLEQALETIELLEPRTAYLTHLSHEFDHGELESRLPEGVRVAHDGLVLQISPSSADGGDGNGPDAVAGPGGATDRDAADGERAGREDRS